MSNNEDLGIKHRGRPRAFDRETALETALKIFWEKGYEPASVAELCKAMGINPPSLYCTFGNKAELFLEALRHYEKIYWEAPARKLLEEPDIHKAIRDFFNEAAEILSSPDCPCGCMLVVAAVNVGENEKRIISATQEMRSATKKVFEDRLRRAIHDGQIPADTDVPALSGALNTLLEGLSLQARDGLFQSELKAIASYAGRMLPGRPR